MSNLIKYFGTVIIIAAGVFVYQYLENHLFALRVFAFLVALVIAAIVFSTSDLGFKCREFLSNARLELKKIKWADKKQTTQMTLIIFLAVVIIGLFLWLIDSIIYRLLQIII